MEKEISRLMDKMNKDEGFRDWMKEHWKAVYYDLLNDTGLYPGFYSSMEQEYINYLDKQDS